jgi:hypothetical protein
MSIVFVSYVSFIFIKYGAQSSISYSYYVLPKKIQVLFTLFCWCFAIPAMIVASTPLMFFAGAGITFLGVAAAFKEEFTYKVHIVGAYGSVILSQLSTIINFHMWPISVVFFTITLLLFLFKVKNKIWWTEILAFLSICVVLAIKIL